MPDEELWKELTSVYNNRRRELLKKLADLDAWYGEQNVLLSIEEIPSSERR